MKKRLLVLIMIINYMFVCTGCFNYKDINRVLFETAIILDIDANDNVILYTEAFKPFKGTAQATEQGVRIVSKTEGKTLFEAVRNFNLSSGYKHNYTQNKAIIFSERAARKGIGKIIDFLDRDQEILVRQNVFIYMGDIEALIKMQFKDEEYLGTYIYSLVTNIQASSRALVLDLNEYLNRRLEKSRTMMVPVIRIKRDAMDPRIELDGGAAVKYDKMLEYVPRQRIQGYNFLLNQVKTGTLEISNPCGGEGYVTLEILNSKTKTTIEYKDEKVIYTKRIKVRASIAESQDTLLFTQENLAALEKNSEKNIKKYTMQLFDDFKRENIDIFEVAEELERHYPKVDIKDPIAITELRVIANVNIEGSSNKNNKY